MKKVVLKKITDKFKKESAKLVTEKKKRPATEGAKKSIAQRAIYQS